MDFTERRALDLFTIGGMTKLLNNNAFKHSCSLNLWSDLDLMFLSDWVSSLCCFRNPVGGPCVGEPRQYKICNSKVRWSHWTGVSMIRLDRRIYDHTGPVHLWSLWTGASMITLDLCIYDQTGPVHLLYDLTGPVHHRLDRCIYDHTGPVCLWSHRTCVSMIWLDVCIYDLSMADSSYASGAFYNIYTHTCAFSRSMLLSKAAYKSVIHIQATAQQSRR